MAGMLVARWNAFYESGQKFVCRARSAATGHVPVKYRNLVVREAHIHALNIYRPKPYPGRLTLFRAIDQPDGYEFDSQLGWNGLAAGIDIHHIPGSHATLFKPPYVHGMAVALNNCLSATHKRE